VVSLHTQDSDDDDTSGAPAAAAAAMATTAATDAELYCFCRRGSFGFMIGCDDDDCAYEWFHLECVGLTPSTRPRGKWYVVVHVRWCSARVALLCAKSDCCATTCRFCPECREARAAAAGKYVERNNGSRRSGRAPKRYVLSGALWWAVGVEAPALIALIFRALISCIRTRTRK